VYSLKHALKGHFMNIVRRLRSLKKPRWDGSRVLFEIGVAGRPVACAISRAALQELSGCHHIASGDLLRRFADKHERIEQIATSIFAIRPESVTGMVNIWADDIDDPPSAPAVACQAAEVRV
jgi:Protein of unknown function (DUF1488)